MYPRGFHFSQWEVSEFSKYFRKVSQTSRDHKIRPSDVLMVYNARQIEALADMKCVKFGMLYPGFWFHPYRRPEHLQKMLPIIDKYDAVFVNEGPIWESLKGHPKVFLVPFSANDKVFKKTRNRGIFSKIIQVARPEIYKGRYIAEEAMKLMPYRWELVPRSHRRTATVDYSRLPEIYQQADGFLSPNMIGPAPDYEIDAKYTQASMEAGLSGCIIFWHDCMSLGNSYKTVFEVSLNPDEIAQRIQSIVSSISLEAHSKATAQEFYEKCNAADAVRVKVKIMEKFL
jgi:hypothetical protein